MKHYLIKLLCSLVLVITLPLKADDSPFFETTGDIAADLRVFTEDGRTASQNSNLSLTLEPEFYREWRDGKDSLTFTPFLRLDEHDSERSHADIRELQWIHVGNNWELRTGFRKVFWGVTEFQHLVDVINQTDNVEDIDNEDKLGQPMINLSVVSDWGIIDAYLLTGFRERTFAGRKGRLRNELIVDTDRARYESAAEQKHIDVALRWSHTLGDYDIGAYWFHGTNRDPQFNIGTRSSGEVVLVPYYEQMDQFGLDVQATLDSWLVKVEAIARDTLVDTYIAGQAGFEYTFYGIKESNADLGVLLEYGVDGRGSRAASAFQNDISMGARLTLNDAVSTELLAGLIHDLDHQSISFQVEASRRFGDHWKLHIDGRFFSVHDSNDLLSSLDKDDHLQIRLERYF